MEAFSFERGADAQTRTQKRACYCLYLLNTLSFGVGVAVLVLSALVASAHESIAGSVYGAAAAGGFLVIVSVCGIIGARRELNGVSGKTLLLVYFYADLFAVAVVAFFSIAALEFRVRFFGSFSSVPHSFCSVSYQDTFDKYIEDHWDHIRDEFPELAGMVRLHASVQFRGISRIA